MRTMWGAKCYLFLAVVAAACPCTLVLAQQTPDLLNGKDSRTEVQVGVYSPDATGNQSGVREYDGRKLNSVGIELFNTYGYDKGLQYWFNAQDLFVQDESIAFGLADRNLFRFSGSMDMLTHRLLRTPANNPWVAAQLSSLVPAPTPVVQGRTWDTFKDLSPNGQYGLDHLFNQLNAYYNADPGQHVGLAAGWWEERDHGVEQLLFRARETKAGVINSGDRGAVALPIDRSTNQGTFGADWLIGKASVINYRFVGTTFNDNRSGMASGSSLDLLPLNSLTQIGSKTSSNVLKARSRITDKLDFTGVHINKERTNARNDIPATYAGAGAILDKKQKINSTNLALVYRPAHSLSFTGRWRQLAEDNLVPPVFSIVGGVPQTTPANQSMSTNLHSLEMEGVYTGIPRTYFRAEFEKRNVDREAGALQPGNDDVALPATSLSTDWNILRVAARYHPLLRLNVSANYENWSSGDSGFVGLPNNLTRTVANATYMIRDNAAIYGDFSCWNESNDQTRVQGAIPTPATNTAGQNIRTEAAGQGLKSTFSTTSIGGWYAANAKLTFDANYGSVIMDSGTTWVIGTDPTSSALPQLPADLVPFKSNSMQLSVGANYRVNRLWKVYLRFFQANSQGASLVTPADFANLGPQWTPVKVKQDRWTLGFGRQLSKKDSLSLDFSVAEWIDKVDAGQTGRYNLWRLAWARQY